MIDLIAKFIECIIRIVWNWLVICYLFLFWIWFYIVCSKIILDSRPKRVGQSENNVILHGEICVLCSVWDFIGFASHIYHTNRFGIHCSGVIILPLYIWQSSALFLFSRCLRHFNCFEFIWITNCKRITSSSFT